MGRYYKDVRVTKANHVNDGMHRVFFTHKKWFKRVEEIMVVHIPSTDKKYEHITQYNDTVKYLSNAQPELNRRLIEWLVKDDEKIRFDKIESRERMLEDKIRWFEHEKTRFQQQVHQFFVDKESMRYHMHHYQPNNTKKDIADALGISLSGNDKIDYRTFASKAHPDRGGSEVLMKIINKMYNK